MGCFPVDFQEVKRPLRTKSVKRPIKVGKRPINKGKRPIKAMVLVGVSVGSLMGCFRAPPPWRKTAPLKRPIKRSMIAGPSGNRTIRIATLNSVRFAVMSFLFFQMFRFFWQTRIYPYPMVWPLPRPWSETMVSIPLCAQKTLEIKGFLGLGRPFLDLVSQTPRPRGRGRPFFADFFKSRDSIRSRFGSLADPDSNRAHRDI